MKKLFLTCPVILIAAVAFALENITLPTGGGFYEGTVYQPRTIAESNITAITPRFVGELLLGKESGSNALWVARDLTTNGWSLVTATGGPFSSDNISDLAATKLTGNIAAARMTNAAGTLGPSIGGNIPLAALTNAAGGGLCVVTNKGVGYTNVITFPGTVSGTLAP